MQANVDLLIIGGGPAGLTAAQYGARAALNTLLVEEMSYGGQALMIDVLENYPGNIAKKTGVELSEDFRKQAEDFGAKLELGAVVSLTKKNNLFEARLEDGANLSARAVILATGAGHKLLHIPGETEFTGKGVSYCASCDGPFFKNKKIFVVGGGDAACDEAYFLSRISPEVTMLVRRETLRAQKAVAQRVLQHESIKLCFNTVIHTIKGQAKVESLLLQDTKTGKTHEENADAVFIFAGIVPRVDLVHGLAVELDSGQFIKTAQNMASSVAGLFAAGDVRSSPFRQVAVAAGEGAVAAHAAAEYIAELSV